MRRIFLVLILTLLPATTWAEVKVVQMQHRAPTEIAEQVRTMLDDGEKVQAAGDFLVIRASGESLTAALELIKGLDRPAEQLVIQVRFRQEHQQVGSRTGGAVHYGTDGLAVSGDSVRLLGNSRDQQLQTLRVQEGSAAWLEVGRDIPYTEELAVFSGDIEGVAEKTAYRNVSTGFSVVPQQVLGDNVLLEIDPRIMAAEGNGDRAPVVSHGGTATRTTVPLGQWIELAAHLRDDDRFGRAVLYSNRSRDQGDLRIFIRIDRADGFSP